MLESKVTEAVLSSPNKISSANYADLALVLFKPYLTCSALGVVVSASASIKAMNTELFYP